jgi:hypothetical protein
MSAALAVTSLKVAVLRHWARIATGAARQSRYLSKPSKRDTERAQNQLARSLQGATSASDR